LRLAGKGGRQKLTKWHFVALVFRPLSARIRLRLKLVGTDKPRAFGQALPWIQLVSIYRLRVTSVIRHPAHAPIAGLERQA
jgi:hypothetical protein